MTSYILKAENIYAGYGQVSVLHCVSLNVQPGEIVGVFGPNGAGKTTLLGSISGLIRLTAGNIKIANRDVTSMPADRRVTCGIAHVPEGRRVFPGLSVLENLKSAHLRAGTSFQDLLARVQQLFPVLKLRNSQAAWSLSGGEQQMLSFARALMSSPTVLLMDEPSLGLAPQVVRSLFDTVRQLAQGGLAVLVVEQNVRVALEYVDRFSVMKGGAIVGTRASHDADVEELLGDVYFGVRQPAHHLP
jgi:branched-chain amino acid transport system ATP-binding protein